MLIHFRKAMLMSLLLISGNQVQAQKPIYTLRLHYHYGSLNPWLFYEIPIQSNIGWLTVFQMSTLGFAQIDIGPNFHFGPLQLIPQVGFEISESYREGARLSHVVPEFYAIYYGERISFESWNLYFINALDEHEQVSFYYYRDFLLFRVLPKLFIGPQAEGYVYPEWNKNYWGGQISLDIGIGTMALFMGRYEKYEHNIFRMTFLKNF